MGHQGELGIAMILMPPANNRFDTQRAGRKGHN
jgi:hypothetical protein